MGGWEFAKHAEETFLVSLRDAQAWVLHSDQNEILLKFGFDFDEASKSEFQRVGDQVDKDLGESLLVDQNDHLGKFVFNVESELKILGLTLISEQFINAI